MLAVLRAEPRRGSCRRSRGSAARRRARARARTRAREPTMAAVCPYMSRSTANPRPRYVSSSTIGATTATTTKFAMNGAALLASQPIRDEALLLAGLEEEVEDGTDHEDRDECRRRIPERPPPRRGSLKAERRGRELPGDHVDDRGDDQRTGSRPRPPTTTCRAGRACRSTRVAARVPGVGGEGEEAGEDEPADPHRGGRDGQATHCHSAHRTTNTARPAVRTADAAIVARRDVVSAASAMKQGNATIARRGNE